MAFNWQKLFENWTWHNRTQSKDTPINATNLNKINNAIDGIDNRVVAVGEALDELVFEDVTVSGNPAVFESRSEQLSKQTTVNIEPIQSGSGTPSPSNIRPISGLDSVDVTVADAQTSPTTSQTYTTTLPTTVYGGTLDLTNGRLVVDRAIVDLGTLNWEKLSNSRFEAKLNGFKYETNAYAIPNMKCSAYKTESYAVAATADHAINSYTVSSYVQIRDISHTNTSASDFKTAMSGIQLVYELTTPVITTITPSSLSLLKGLNVVSTNGDTVEVTFNDPVSHDDLDGKLDKTDVATVEGDTASKAYAVNEFMLRSDGFYRVIAPIASGASITSSNTTKTTIGAVLTALLNS